MFSLAPSEMRPLVQTFVSQVACRIKQVAAAQQDAQEGSKNPLATLTAAQEVVSSACTSTSAAPLPAVNSANGPRLLNIRDVSCVSPRGKFALEFGSSALVLVGKGDKMLVVPKDNIVVCSSLPHPRGTSQILMVHMKSGLEFGKQTLKTLVIRCIQACDLITFLIAFGVSLCQAFVCVHAHCENISLDVPQRSA